MSKLKQHGIDLKHPTDLQEALDFWKVILDEYGIFYEFRKWEDAGHSFILSSSRHPFTDQLQTRNLLKRYLALSLFTHMPMPSADKIEVLGTYGKDPDVTIQKMALSSMIGAYLIEEDQSKLPIHSMKAFLRSIPEELKQELLLSGHSRFFLAGIYDVEYAEEAIQLIKQEQELEKAL